MSRPGAGRGHVRADIETDTGVVADKKRWISRRQAARELGIDHRTFIKVAAAARVHTKKVPGRLGVLYLLSDVLRTARESVGIASETGTARPR